MKLKLHILIAFAILCSFCFITSVNAESDRVRYNTNGYTSTNILNDEYIDNIYNKIINAYNGKNGFPFQSFNAVLSTNGFILFCNLTYEGFTFSSINSSVYNANLSDCPWSISTNNFAVQNNNDINFSQLSENTNRRGYIYSYSTGGNIYYPDAFIWSSIETTIVATPSGFTVPDYSEIPYIFKRYCDNSYIPFNTPINSMMYCAKGYNIKPASDVLPPIITLNGATTVNIEINTLYEELGASCTDDTDDTCIVSYSDNIDITTLGTYTVTYNATDDAGNSSMKTRTVNVIDTTPPVITLYGSDILTMYIGEEYQELGAYATDNSFEDIEVLVDDTELTINEKGEYFIKYISCDSSDNCTEISRKIIIKMPKPINTFSSQYLFFDFEDITNIFSDIDFTGFTYSEQFTATILFNIFFVAFIAFILSLLYKIGVRIWDYFC